MENDKNSSKPLQDKRGTASACEKYELAITSYVLGEETELPKAELEAHLKTCKNCRQDLKEWKEAVAILRAEAHDAKPEAKKKRAELLAEIKGQPSGQEQCFQCLPSDIDLKQIGWDVGDVWRCIGEHGPIPITDLPVKCNMPPWKITATFFWLVGEKKVEIVPDTFPNQVRLTPEEQNLYFEETGKLKL